MCTCGRSDSHQIAWRRTFDDKIVCLWSDGALTWALGAAIRGTSFPRTDAQRDVARRVGRLVLEDVCLYDTDEVPGLISAAHAAVKRHPSADPGDLRDEIKRRNDRASTPTPRWEEQAGFRVWHLPRLLGLGGLAIWHENGRYSVLRVGRGPVVGDRSREALFDTGAHATSLRRAYALAVELASRSVS